MFGVSFYQAARRPFANFCTTGVALAITLLTSCAASRAQIVVQNASFENNSSQFTSYPGYVNDPGNTTIAGWTSSFTNLGNSLTGLNNEATTYPFADPGILPDGPTVAFLQTFSSAEPTTLSQDLSGFVIGQQYSVTFFANARSNYDTPNLTVSLGGVDLFSQDVSVVGADNPYHEFTTSAFTATSSTATLTFSSRLSPSTTSGDGAVVLDAVRVNGIAGAAAPEPGSCSLALIGVIPLGASLVRRCRKKH